MTRNINRKTKKEVRWDASTGGIEPNVVFEKKYITLLTAINPNGEFIPTLESYCGRFLLHESIELNKPTSGDYQRTMDDLERVASDFIDRLTKLEGHELEALIDSSWYVATKKLPVDRYPLRQLAIAFRQTVRVAQINLPQMGNTNGRTRTTAPIKDLIFNCKEAMSNCGSTEEEVASNYKNVVRYCLSAIKRDHLIDGLRHHL